MQVVVFWSSYCNLFSYDQVPPEVVFRSNTIHCITNMSIPDENQQTNHSTTNLEQTPRWVSWKSYSTPSEKQPPINPDKFTEAIKRNETKPDTDNCEFKKNSSKQKQDYYHHLKLVNMGRWNGFWRDETHERYIFKKNLAEILTGHLDLKQRQRSRVAKLFTSLDLRSYRKYDKYVPRTVGGKRDKWPLVIFCISILTCWEQGRVYYPDPNTSDRKKDRVFARIADELELPNKAIISCVNKLRSELDGRIRDPKDPPKQPTNQHWWGRGI